MNPSSPDPCMRRIPRVLLPLLPLLALLLAGCNESASNKLATASIVLAGDLLVDGSNVRMKVNLGKHDSTVVVVLEGGDALFAGNGASHLHMDYTADIFGSHYRATFPLNTAATYSTTLVRGFDGSSVRSEFPPLPGAFSITAPAGDPLYSLAATPAIYVAWDTPVVSEHMELESIVDCDWDVTPPGGGLSAISRSSGDYRRLSAGERSVRQAMVRVADAVSRQRAEIVLMNPGSDVVLRGCDVDFRLHAKTFGNAGSALSWDSRMTSRRVVEASARFVP